MNSVKIIRMEASHIQHVLAIEEQVFSHPWSGEVFLQELRSVSLSRAFVAIQDEKVVGYLIAWFVREEVHLVNIAVHPGKQRQGIGSFLLSHLLEEGIKEKKRIVTLEVRSSNSVAQAFYKSFFFENVGIRKRYYSDNKEDAVLMALDLDSYQRFREGGGAGGGI